MPRTVAQNSSESDEKFAPETEVRILRVAGGGDGVGRLTDGRTVFVPRTAPGDLVELRYFKHASRYSRGRVVRVLEPGPNRVIPPCPHYTRDQCGGCQLQHMTLDAQLSAKQAIVGEALRRVGGISVEDPTMVPAAKPWEYRAKITLAVDGRGRIGLHPWDQPTAVFALDRCHITDPSLMALWRVIRRYLRLLPEKMSHLVLRLDRDGARHVVVMVAGTDVWQSAPRLAERLAVALVPAILWWHPEGGAPRVVAGARDAYPATVFEQVNPQMGDLVRSYALEQLGQVEGQHVWDLYAGIGESTTSLLRAGASVESVEIDPRAVRIAERRVRESLGLSPEAPLPSRVACRVGLVEEVAGRLSRPDLVLANPPRAGMDSGAIEAIVAVLPRKLVYISCDPATLARDIARLKPTFRVVGTQGFDLFPQTAHVETVAILEAA
ncbi:MAG: TRAM domain-containing protein [Gemmatimonadota bacterium]